MKEMSGDEVKQQDNQKVKCAKNKRTEKIKGEPCMV